MSTEMYCHLPSGATEINKVLNWTSRISQTQTKSNISSYNVSAILPCVTKVAFTKSPKDRTLRKTGTFLGKSLRSTRGNFFMLFECQTVYVQHPMVSAAKWFEAGHCTPFWNNIYLALLLHRLINYEYEAYSYKVI